MTWKEVLDARGLDTIDRAREIAIETGHEFFAWKDGQVYYIYPDTCGINMAIPTNITTNMLDRTVRFQERQQ